MNLKILKDKFIILILLLINLNGKNQPNKMFKYYQKKLIIIKIRTKLKVILQQLRY